MATPPRPVHAPPSPPAAADCTLTVTVKYGARTGEDPDPDPRRDIMDQDLEGVVQYLDKPTKFVVANATVKISGPEEKSGTTDEQGKIVFDRIKPGKYKISVSYEKKNPLADAARSNIGQGRWAIAADRTDEFSGYRGNDAKGGGGKDKCNLFVYDMTKRIGKPPPTKWGFSFSSHPPLAEDWAEEKQNLLGVWAIYRGASPQPGDVVATKFHSPGKHRGATGHVAIVSYPDPNLSTAIWPVKEHDRVEATVYMAWTVVSEGGYGVHETYWPFHDDDVLEYDPPVFRRAP